MYSAIAKYSDVGAPVVLTLPEAHTISKLYKQLGEGVIEEMENMF